MRKTVYDFTQAAQHADEWYKPSELSDMLKTEFLALAHIAGKYPDEIAAIQQAIWSTTQFLDRIEEREVGV